MGVILCLRGYTHFVNPGVLMEQVDSEEEYWDNFANSSDGRRVLDRFEAAGYPRNSAKAVILLAAEDDENGLGPEDIDPRFFHVAGIYGLSLFY